MPRYANADESERILKTLRKPEVFTVISPRHGDYDKPGFIPGYGKYKDGWSDQKVADLIGGKVGRSTIAYLRQNWFGNLQISGTTAPQPEKKAAPVAPSPVAPSPDPSYADLVARLVVLEEWRRTLRARADDLQLPARVTALEERYTRPSDH